MSRVFFLNLFYLSLLFNYNGKSILDLLFSNISIKLSYYCINSLLLWISIPDYMDKLSYLLLERELINLVGFFFVIVSLCVN